MKERINKRSVAAGIATAALAFGVVAGSLAYLQDYTSTIENEFTVGAIDIELAETAVDEYGVAVPEAAPVTSGSQEYKLIPDHEYLKDPVVTVAADSEDCYVYFVIDNQAAGLEDANDLISNQIVDNGWTLLYSESGLYVNGAALGENQSIYYKAVSSSNVDQALDTFDTLHIDANADVATADGNSIDVQAFAVQQDGFGSALGAWEATFGVAPVIIPTVIGTYDDTNNTASFALSELGMEQAEVDTSTVTFPVENIVTDVTVDSTNLVVTFDSTIAAEQAGNNIMGLVSSTGGNNVYLSVTFPSA